MVMKTYLHHRRYPDGFSKVEKVNLRRKCCKNFLFEGGLLYCRRAKSADEMEEDWKRTGQNFVGTEKEKERSMESFHAGDEGIV